MAEFYHTELEPALVSPDIRPHKFFIRLRQINNAFDDADDAADATEHAEYKLDDPFLGVTQNEFMDPESTEEDGQ